MSVSRAAYLHGCTFACTFTYICKHIRWTHFQRFNKYLCLEKKLLTALDISFNELNHILCDKSNYEELSLCDDILIHWYSIKHFFKKLLYEHAGYFWYHFRRMACSNWYWILTRFNTNLACIPAHIQYDCTASSRKGEGCSDLIMTEVSMVYFCSDFFVFTWACRVNCGWTTDSSASKQLNVNFNRERMTKKPGGA